MSQASLIHLHWKGLCFSRDIHSHYVTYYLCAGNISPPIFGATRSHLPAMWCQELICVEPHFTVPLPFLGVMPMECMKISFLIAFLLILNLYFLEGVKAKVFHETK